MAVAGSPTNLTHYLRGIQFPVNRDGLIRHARNQGADQEVLDVINGMPDRQYQNMADVMGAYGQYNQDVDEDFEVNVEDEDTEEIPQQRRRA